jgi:hypothetical protein
MKYVISFIVIIISGYLYIGCDNPTQTKATNVSPPSLVSPSDYDSMVPVTPTFTWNGNATKLEVATNPDFSNIVHSAEVSGNQYTLTPPPLQHGLFYYWRAGISTGQNVYWSENYYTFRTAP